MFVHGMTIRKSSNSATMIQLGKYSFGIGDRFEHQGEALLKAINKASEAGIHVIPVWNKSNREHHYVNTEPISTRKEADAAVASLGWNAPYLVDADHINLSNVDRFIPFCDFYTIDVASWIDKPAPPESVDAFKQACGIFGTSISVPGLEVTVQVNNELITRTADKYLSAVQEASRIYRHIEAVKGHGTFVAEISLDEVEVPQTPVDMLFILKMIADLGIPIQTIAPKFTGRFNKGVDYIGDTEKFALEFEQHLLVIDYAVKNFGLPENLKLSVHSGSDKFTIYPVMVRLLRKHDKGIHLKTAGTTWLEEVIGLALSDGDALMAVKEIYSIAYSRREELCAPYSDVIDITEAVLPSPDLVNGWTGSEFAGALRHIQEHPGYNPDFRQLIHVAYKVAAEMGPRFLSLLKENREVIGKCVEENIWERHLQRLFLPLLKSVED